MSVLWQLFQLEIPLTSSMVQVNTWKIQEHNIVLARTMSNGYVSVVAVVPARDPANILNGAGKYLKK